MQLYKKLFERYGAQGWWPAKTRFEVVVGAILTQQTSWSNAERAIANLKKMGLLNVEKLVEADAGVVEACCKPTGFYKQKAKRVRFVSKYFAEKYGGQLGRFFAQDLEKAREELLALHGIGEETADSILLYAGNKPVFVVDAYTKRVLERFGFEVERRYGALQEFFEERLPHDVQLYKEFHALLVRHAKEVCRSKPLCASCFLRKGCKSGKLVFT